MTVKVFEVRIVVRMAEPSAVIARKTPNFGAGDGHSKFIAAAADLPSIKLDGTSFDLTQLDSRG